MASDANVWVGITGVVTESQVGQMVVNRTITAGLLFTVVHPEF
jgi:hypothetical protein